MLKTMWWVFIICVTVACFQVGGAGAFISGIFLAGYIFTSGLYWWRNL